MRVSISLKGSTDQAVTLCTPCHTKTDLHCVTVTCAPARDVFVTIRFLHFHLTLLLDSSPALRGHICTYLPSTQRATKYGRFYSGDKYDRTSSFLEIDLLSLA